MKKLLLFILTVNISLSAYTKTLNHSTAIKSKPASVKMKTMKAQMACSIQDVISKRKKMQSPSTEIGEQKISSTLTETLIGRTIYDLQSNKSVGNRVSNNGDGTISAVWTQVNPGGLPDKSNTGYNYYNGTAWLPPPMNSLDTSGAFPNIDITQAGEFIVAHGDSGITLAKRFIKGTGSWTKDTVGNWALFPIQQDLWPRFAAGGSTGNTLHVITNSQGMETVPILGQNDPLTYSRSTDGGITWVDDHIQIPGTDSTFMYGVGAEDYHIDARGDVVAIVIGGFTNDVVLLKSIDGGISWVRTVILPFPLGSIYNPNTMNTDTTGDGIGELVSSNAGDVTVIIDTGNICHVSFSHMFVSEDSGNTEVSYYPLDNTGLYYWREGMTAPAIIASAEDFNGNGFIDVATNPMDTTDPGVGLYNVGLCAQPSIGIDSSNNIYIAYSALDERADTTAWQESFRHIFLISSTDGGLTWTSPYTLNPSPDGDFQEAVWPSVASFVDKDVHIVYQRDPAPGHSLSDNATQMSNNLLSPSDIIYARVFSRIYSNTISGHCFIDINQNGIWDNNESAYKHLKVQSTGNNLTYSSMTDNNGYFENSLDTGTSTTFLPNLHYYISNPTQHASTFATYNNIDTVNFALAPIPGIQDLKISLIPTTNAVPGFDGTYELIYSNVGTLTITGNIYFIINNNQTYVSSSIGTSSIIANTLVFNYYNLSPNETRILNVRLHNAATPFLNIGDTIGLIAFIYPITSDSIPSDNGMIITQDIAGSFDPNDKTMLGGPSITPTQVNSGEYLHYLIRFQNTGTDTAFTVIVKDTLSTNLNWNSLEMESASHPYNLTITDGNILKWQFNNINLPDSNVNETASHGYIAYKIKPQNTLTIGNTINNSAYIYFDYNLPVATNVAHTLVDVVGIKENSGNGLSANIYPNPNNGTFNIDLGKIYHDVDIKVCNVFGQVISQKQPHSTSNIIENIHGATGLYFVHVITENGNAVLRIVKN